MPRDKKNYVVSFMGFAPVEDPQVLIYTVVDRPNARFQDDAKFATGIVRNVLSEVLPYLNIYMTEELTEEERQELESRQIEILENYARETEAPEESAATPDLTQEQTETPENTDAVEENGEGDDLETIHVEQLWKQFPKDPETGYLVDPETGDLIDPDTGASMTGYTMLESGFSSPGMDLTGPLPESETTQENEPPAQEN